MSLPVIGSAIALVFVLYVKRRLWRKWWLWLTVALLGLIHALMIWVLPWSEAWHPAIIGGAIISVDVCLIFWILATVEALVEGRTTADSPQR